MKLPRKRINEFTTHVFGFPVVLINVPMVLIHGEWTPDLDYNKLGHAVMLALAKKPARLTGDEIRYLRSAWAMTLQEFGARFSVRHSAVIKWERAADKPTSMDWATEKDIVLEILRRAGVKPATFASAYAELAKSRPKIPQTKPSLDVRAALSQAA